MEKDTSQSSSNTTKIDAVIAEIDKLTTAIQGVDVSHDAELAKRQFRVVKVLAAVKSLLLAECADLTSDYYNWQFTK